MGRTNWIAGVALFGMLAATDVTAQTSDSLTINVLVIDEVGVPAVTVRPAGLNP